MPPDPSPFTTVDSDGSGTCRHDLREVGVVVSRADVTHIGRRVQNAPDRWCRAGPLAQRRFLRAWYQHFWGPEASAAGHRRDASADWNDRLTPRDTPR